MKKRILIVTVASCIFYNLAFGIVCPRTFSKVLESYSITTSDRHGEDFYPVLNNLDLAQIVSAKRLVCDESVDQNAEVCLLRETRVLNASEQLCSDAGKQNGWMDEYLNNPQAPSEQRSTPRHIDSGNINVTKKLITVNPHELYFQTVGDIQEVKVYIDGKPFSMDHDVEVSLEPDAPVIYRLSPKSNNTLEVKLERGGEGTYKMLISAFGEKILLPIKVAREDSTQTNLLVYPPKVDMTVGEEFVAVVVFWGNEPIPPGTEVIVEARLDVRFQYLIYDKKPGVLLLRAPTVPPGNYLLDISANGETTTIEASLH